MSWMSKRCYGFNNASFGSSVTRLGDLLHFGQLFKACGNNSFAQIYHFLGNFCKGVKFCHLSSEIILGTFYRHLATFYWSHCLAVVTNVTTKKSRISFKRVSMKLESPMQQQSHLPSKV